MVLNDDSNLYMSDKNLYIILLYTYACVTYTFCPTVFQTAFVVWANSELQHFVSRFSCQVFRREMGVAAIGVCVSMAKQQCEKVNIFTDANYSVLELTQRCVITTDASITVFQKC